MHNDVIQSQSVKGSTFCLIHNEVDRRGSGLNNINACESVASRQNLLEYSETIEAFCY